MSFDVYSKICEIFYKGKNPEYLFAHAFLTIEWNLMARSDNCVNMHINHVQWHEDAMLFFFGKSKGNQGGDRADKPWHVYSNPQMPFLCPVLAMAKYTLTHPDLFHDSCPLFPGLSQYSRFVKFFHKLLNDNAEVFERMGVKKGDIGSHSVRKGSITLVSSGCTVSPPMSFICLRACWSMGPVKDTYIHYEKAGDQFVGRSVTGISSLSKQFAVSPAYFDSSGSEEGTMKKIDDIIYVFLSGKRDEVLGPVFLLVRFMFASICFHYNHLFLFE